MPPTNDSRSKRSQGKPHGGFTLIELLIVVAIILIIAALAVPSLLRSKVAANQADAVGDLRTIVTAAVTYDSTYGNYPTKLTQVGGTGSLPSCDGALLVDSVLGGSDPSKKSGYSFTMLAGNQADTVNCATAESTDGFAVTAVPLVVGTTGQRSFCGDGNGEIRYDSTGAAFTVSNASCSAGSGIIPQ